MSYSGTPKITVLSGPGSSEGKTNRRLYLGLAGGILAALLVGGGFKLWQHRQASQGVTNATPEASQASNPDDAATLTMTEGQPADFDAPFLAAAPTADAAEPNLLQSTASQNRMPAVAAGRPDPFAPLVAPLRSPSRPTPLQVAAPPPPPSPMTTAPVASAPARPLPAVPVAATQSLPPLPTVSIPSLPVPPIPGGLPLAATGSTDLPPAMPNPVALSAIEQVAVSGVVQIGQQVHVIVTEPGNPSGRRVSQGDTVAGGQVRIKAIDLSSTDPTVVLTYNGQDYYRTVGSGAL